MMTAEDKKIIEEFEGDLKGLEDRYLKNVVKMVNDYDWKVRTAAANLLEMRHEARLEMDYELRANHPRGTKIVNVMTGKCCIVR